MRDDWGSVTDRAAREIRRMIDEGRIDTGGKLPGQREIAEMLKVSRPAVREALARLQTLGLIEVRPGLGAFLTSPEKAESFDVGKAWHFSDTASPEEIYQMRYAMEGFAVRMASRRATEADAEELISINTKMATCLRNGDKASAAEQDLAFHLAIVRLAGNRAMFRVMEGMDAPIVATQMMPLHATARLMEPIDEHGNVIRAIASGDAELASTMMRYHISRAAERAGAAFLAG